MIERGKLEAFLELNLSTREIATKLGRHHSTIAREIKRNRLASQPYKVSCAEFTSTYRRSNVPRSSKLTSKLIEIKEGNLQCIGDAVHILVQSIFDSSVLDDMMDDDGNAVKYDVVETYDDLLDLVVG